MKDAVATMGGLLPDDAGGRDAVHVAVISAVAGEKLQPGQHVGLSDVVKAGGEYVATMSATKALGIVDPFLTLTVQPNDRFWLYIYPRKITGLNHQWSHPDLPDMAGSRAGELYSTPAQKLASENWLRHFAETADCPGYETLMNAAIGDHDKNYDPDEGGYMCSRIEGEYLHFGGRDAHGEIPPEFWDHVEIVSGKKIKQRPTYFSCSC